MEGVSQLAERVKERIIQNTDNNDLFRLARAGDKKAVAETKTLVREQLYDMRINATNDLIQDIFNVIWGLGQIQHLYDDPEVNEIWVNGAGENVWVEREGRRVKAHGVMFQNDD